MRWMFATLVQQVTSWKNLIYVKPKPNQDVNVNWSSYQKTESSQEDYIVLWKPTEDIL